MPYISYPRDCYTWTFLGLLRPHFCLVKSQAHFAHGQPETGHKQNGGSQEVKLQLSLGLVCRSSPVGFTSLLVSPLPSASQSAGSMQRCCLSICHLERATTASSYRPWQLDGLLWVLARPCVSAGEGWLTTPSKNCLHQLGNRHFQEVLSASCGSNNRLMELKA